MRLAQLPALLLEEPVRKMRRRAIAGAIVAVCCIGAAVEAVSAARVALEPQFGEIGARLILVGAFAGIAALSALALFVIERRAGSIATDAPREDPRARIIAEAVATGYALGRDFINAKPNGHAPEAEAPGANEASGHSAAP